MPVLFIGSPISGEILCEKAKYFYKEITKNDDFKASHGWLQKFKQRYGIRQLTISGEMLSSNFEAAVPFKEKFRRKIQEMGLSREQIYNADESGLFWRLLPTKTLAHFGEKSAPGRKIGKERITFMPCANATANHKLTLFVLGKAQAPRAFKNCRIPVSYKGQRKAWVTREIFSEWFHTEFVPAVRTKMKELNLPPKAILLLDNAPGHPQDLASDDKKIVVMFLPANCTPILQPMDQHVIQAIKVFYRKTLLKTVIESDVDIPQALKNLNLKDVVFSLDESWQRVSSELIKKSWNNLLGPLVQDESDDDDEDNIPLHTLAHILREKATAEHEIGKEIEEIIELTKQIEETATNQEIQEWANGKDEISELMLTDQDIISEAQEHAVEEGNTTDEESEISTVKHGQAVAAFNTCIKWASENTIPACKLIMLQELRNLAVNAERSSMKQKRITDYYMY